jgi:drug/metabolite transporter (DMT)-like permease
MPQLITTSLIWAFSFGITMTWLGRLDSALVSAARLGLALLVFLPALRWKGLAPRTALVLTGIGALQFGLMYLALNASYHHFRASYQVVLFTLTTPIMVTLFADALERRLHPRALLAAVVAMVGTAVAVIGAKSTEVAATVAGIVLVQLSNLAFALGQVLYQRLRRQQPALRDREVFGLLYAGAFAVTALAFLMSGAATSIRLLTPAQIGTLLYLGILASGIGFFLWNVGATRVSAGVLAVMNNLKVPLGITCSLLFFHEQANVPWLLASLALLGLAVWLVQRPAKRDVPS